MIRSPAEERRYHLEQARDAFLRAAASVLDWSWHSENLVAAILWGGRGLLHIAQADPDFIAGAAAVALLERIRADKGDEESL